MIAHYRNDVAMLRTGITAMAHAAVSPIALAAHDYRRAPLAPGEPAEREHKAATPAPPAQPAPEGTRSLADVVAHRLDQRHPQADCGTPRIHSCDDIRNDRLGFLNSLLSAAESGDQLTFRRLTQVASTGEPAQVMQARAVSTVDRQETQQRGHALQQQAPMQMGGRSL